MRASTQVRRDSNYSHCSPSPGQKQICVLHTYHAWGHWTWSGCSSWSGINTSSGWSGCSTNTGGNANGLNILGVRKEARQRGLLSYMISSWNVHFFMVEMSSFSVNLPPALMCTRIRSSRIPQHRDGFKLREKWNDEGVSSKPLTVHFTNTSHSPSVDATPTCKDACTSSDLTIFTHTHSP